MKGKKALGLIETYGLVTAMEAADAAVKAANVKLIGYELARGSGLTTIKVAGDVGGVKASVSAAEAAASRIGKVVATHVIPRPHDDVDLFIKQETKKLEKPAIKKAKDEKEEVEDEKEDDKKEVEQKVKKVEEKEPEPTPTCNMCEDPLCPRRKGDPRVNCIHYKRESS